MAADTLPSNPDQDERLPSPEVNQTPAPSGGTVPLPSPLQEKLNEAKKQQLENIKARLTGGAQKLQPKTATNSAKPAREATEKEVRQRAAQVIGDRLKQGAKVAAKRVQAAAKQWAVRAAEIFVADNPIAWIIGIIVGIILVIFLVIGAIIAVSSLRGTQGNGPAQYPASASERAEVSKLAALSGSQLANSQLVQQTVAAEKARLTVIQGTISKTYASDATKAAAAKEQLKAIISSMDAITAESDIQKRRAAIVAIETQLRDFTTKYPEVLGYGATNGAYLPVPGVIEATGGDCGQASVLMVVLFYNPAFRDDQFYDPIRHATKDNRNCVSPDYISNHTTAKGWVRAPKSASTIADIKESLAGGDPVIVYTRAGSIE